MDDSLACKKVLDAGNMCVICYNGMVFTNNKKGIKPLLEFLDSNFDFSMYSSAKDYIDLPEAFIYYKLGIKNIYSNKLTNSAKAFFDSNKFTYHYKELVDFPIDSYEYKFYEVIKDIDDIDLGIKLLKDKLEELKEV